MRTPDEPVMEPEVRVIVPTVSLLAPMARVAPLLMEIAELARSVLVALPKVSVPPLMVVAPW